MSNKVAVILLVTVLLINVPCEVISVVPQKSNTLSNYKPSLFSNVADDEELTLNGDNVNGRSFFLNTTGIETSDTVIVSSIVLHISLFALIALAITNPPLPTPGLGQAPRGYPQPGTLNGGGNPDSSCLDRRSVCTGSEQDAIGMVPCGGEAISIFTSSNPSNPFACPRTTPANAVIFKEPKSYHKPQYYHGGEEKSSSVVECFLTRVSSPLKNLKNLLNAVKSKVNGNVKYKGGSYESPGYGSTCEKSTLTDRTEEPGGACGYGGFPDYDLRNAGKKTIAEDCSEDADSIRYGVRVRVTTVDDEPCDDPKNKYLCDEAKQLQRVIECEPPSYHNPYPQCDDDPYKACFGDEDCPSGIQYGQQRYDSYEEAYFYDLVEAQERQTGEKYKSGSPSRRAICTGGTNCRLRVDRAVQKRNSRKYGIPLAFVQGEHYFTEEDLSFNFNNTG